jgi:hypothetical protein
MAQLIPVTSAPNQTLRCDLSVDGSTLTLTLQISYNDLAGYWVMGILDANGNMLVDSLPLITGVWPGANILSQFGYLKIGSCFLINTGNPLQDNPGPNDLGKSYQLLWDNTA